MKVKIIFKEENIFKYCLTKIQLKDWDKIKLFLLKIKIFINFDSYSN